VFCGIDWAEDHHDVALVDTDGKLIGKRRIGDDAAGFSLLLQLLTDAGDSAEEPIPVAIETSRGLLVACLRATGRKVFAINPMAVSRYRDRHSVARKKSDAGDALVLAHILRTDIDAHRPLPADSELAQAIAVLARAQQDAVWERTCAHNKLRSLLREYYPAILAAFADKRDGLLRPEARAVLAAAPTPAAGAALTKPQLRALLKRAGRQRGLEVEAARIQTALRATQLRQLPKVQNAFGRQALALLRLLDAACTNAEELATEAIKHFDQHPGACRTNGVVGRLSRRYRACVRGCRGRRGLVVVPAAGVGRSGVVRLRRSGAGVPPEFEQVVGRADEFPFAVDGIASAALEPSAAAHVFDLAERRLDRLAA
jgi:transposase